MSSTFEDLGVVADGQPSAPAAEGSGAVARLLEIAANNADQLLDEAKAEADAVRAAGRVEAEKLVSDARVEVGKIRAGLEQERSRLDAEIARLRTDEQEHRDRMRDHLHDLLAKVEASGVS